MYSFAQRSDTRVVDEPLYGHYLRSSGADHPGRDEVMAAVDCDGERVVRQVILGPCDRPVLLLKQMAHHLVDLDRSFLAATANVLLIRDPAEVLRSLRHQLGTPRLADTGIAVQSSLFDELRHGGGEPPVVDSRELLLAPAAVLEKLCAWLGIDPDDAMLSWPAGGRPEDGVWAPHWYANVHRSTGFQPYRSKTGEFPDRLRPILEEARPHYDRLLHHALRADA